MASEAKDKIQLLEKEEIKRHKLIKNLTKALNLWFIDNKSFKELLYSCVDIIVHGLKTAPEKQQAKPDIDALVCDSSPATSTASSSVNKRNDITDLNLNELHKIIDAFEWVRNAVIIRRTSANTLPPSVLSRNEVSSIRTFIQKRYLDNENLRQSLQPSLASYLRKWLEENLSEHNLCGFLQYLVNDKELLEEHYNEEALLRQKKDVAVLVIGLTAFETQQYGLLQQIKEMLTHDMKLTKLHERSNSQPNIIQILSKKSDFSELKIPKIITSASRIYPVLSLASIRRTQSLPELITKGMNTHAATVGFCLKRTRCKTIGAIKHKATSPQNIPQKIGKWANCNVNPSDSNTINSGSFTCDYDDSGPTTSQASSIRSKSPLSNYNRHFNTSATSSLMSTSESSFNSNNTTKCIQLINTDDIKIWTDHSWELKQKIKQQKQLEPKSSFAIPTPVKPSKSLSPLNSFFYSLFNTPPSHTSWYMDHDSQTENHSTETAIESILPDNINFQKGNSTLSPKQESSSLSLSSTVFDKFLPIDGKKVRCRKYQSLFDDVSTTLRYSGINKLSSVETESSSSTLKPGIKPLTSKNCQSLTMFLQMSHLSRHNTELEKENAHFRISEAIISAIEHIKWKKLETQRDNGCREALPFATDCLASPFPLQNDIMLTTTANDIEGEHVPYAELEEVSYNVLSAEVVGLSLISKFDEKHLPKVSEIKWLVSDDDTPQKLLPLPDLSSSANPDENVIHSATRGTRYWAPPRQQIIFTDHPSPNRKELLKKQSYRCAGCGMRVSPQYMKSFRYCTYLGKYHCTGCHRNQISATPAKILQAWDFKCYPVSVFAYRLLEQMYAYPLFYVPDLNPALYIRRKSLLSARIKRLQLKYVKDFIVMCRFALCEQSYFLSVPDYITADIDNWSMSDFVDARAKCLHRSIYELINKCEKHIFNCVLCLARGFVCEYCHDDDVIYPWCSRVERCDACGTCFHRICWKSLGAQCCRCQRINKRRDEIDDVI